MASSRKYPMRTSLIILFCIVSLLNNQVSFCQERHGGRVAIHFENRDNNWESLYNNVRECFNNILRSNGLEPVNDSTATSLAHRYRTDNEVRAPNEDDSSYGENPEKTTDSLYVFSVRETRDSIYLSVTVTDIKQDYPTQSQNSKIAKDLLTNNPDQGAKYLTFSVASSLGLIPSNSNELTSLLQWENNMRQSAQDVEDNKRKQYTLLSFLPPVNQFQSHTSKGTANGIAISTGYAISIGGFIWSTASYNINKRRYDDVSVDLSEADKARAYYNSNMDMCRGGQIASAVLFAGSYIYGVVNALSNRSTYQSNHQITLAPMAYENGGGIALVYVF